jgi:hypothetical protein
MTTEDPKRAIFAHTIHEKFGSRPLFDSNLIISIVNYTLYDPDQHTLCFAGQYGNMELARYCIVHGTEEEKSRGIVLGLVCAACNGHFEVFVYLAEFEMKDRAKYDVDYARLLLHAIKYGCVGIVKYIIDHASGCGLECVSTRMLRLALGLGRYEIFWQAIRAFVYSQEDLGEVLLFAVRNDLDVVQYLVERGADVNYRNSGPFYGAASFGPVPILEYLFTQSSSEHNIGMAITGAIERDRPEIIAYLVEFGFIDWAHVRDPQLELNEMLREAAMHRSGKVVKYLIGRADIAAFGDVGVLAAAAISDMDMLKMAIAHGANIHTDNGRALAISIQRGNLEMAKFLVDHGVEMSGETLNMHLNYINPAIRNFLTSNRT